MLKLIAALLFSLSFVSFAQEPVPAAAETEATPATEPEAKASKPVKAKKETNQAKAKKPKKPLTEKQKAQRAKMKACNKSAKEQDLHKAERKAFMKDCLKKD